MSLMRLLEDSDDNDDDNDMDRDRDKAAAGSGLYLVGLEILAHRKLDYLSSRDDELTIRRGSEDAGRYLDTIAKCLPNLRSLDLFDVVDVYSTVTLRQMRCFLNTCSVDLERLVLSLSVLQYEDVGDDEKVTEGSLTATETTKAHPVLKFLSMRGLLGSADRVLPSFLFGCTGLETIISLEASDLDVLPFIEDNSPVQSTLEQITGTHFKEILLEPEDNNDTFTAEWISEITKIDNIVEGSAQKCWHRISVLATINGGGPFKTSSAIVEACRQGLVHLHLHHGWQWKSLDVQSILCNATNLRIFSAIYLPTMSASDVVSSTWECRWLTRLSVQIRNIPRPDIVIDRKGRIRSQQERAAEGTMEASRVLQRKVYRQLGALTCLESLDLGIDSECGSRQGFVDDVDGVIYDPLFQLDCLEMTLESGLDLLRDLQSLRSLRLVGMEHRIGIPELTWIEHRFPRLERLRGVDPEIPLVVLNLIADRLGPQSLARVALLNKACNKTWTPLLYKTVRIATTLQRRRFMTTKCLQALSRNSQYVTTIQTRYPLTLLPFTDKDEVPQLQLHILDILTDARAETLTLEEDQAIVEILARSPGLVHLSVRRAPLYPVRILMTIVRYQTVLRTLSLFNVTDYDKIPEGSVELAKVFLDRCSSELETLILALNIGDMRVAHDPFRYGGPLSATGEVPAAKKKHPKLKVFALVGLQDGSELEWHVLKLFLPGCTGLQILDGARTQLADGIVGWVTDCSDVQDGLGQAKGVWPQVIFSKSHPSRPDGDKEDRQLATTIVNITKEKDCRFRPVWHTITLHYYLANTNLTLTAKAIAKRILASCHDLRQFDSFHEEEYSMVMYPELSAKVMVSSPWVCRWLTVLHLEITDIPRPDIKADYIGDAYNEYHLKEQKTKKDEIEEDVVGSNQFQMNCLEMSLESGLDLMSGLKELRILDVTFMCHRIGVHELEWMETNWPNLASLRGLDAVRAMEDKAECKAALKNAGFFGPEVMTWARQNKVEWLPSRDRIDQHWRWLRDEDGSDADETEEEKRAEAEERREWERKSRAAHTEMLRSMGI
ncbi:hypothetical protein BGX23_007944 [Mortierella sp. AD031]|nr:hypothetical protein BGX23_007944 [Mortierella sp. AD031]